MPQALAVPLPHTRTRITDAVLDEIVYAARLSQTSCQRNAVMSASGSRTGAGRLAWPISGLWTLSPDAEGN